MSGAQAGTVVVAVCAILLSAAFAPYTAYGSNNLHRLMGGGVIEDYQKRIHSPLWAPPTPYTAASRTAATHTLTRVELNKGMLGMWWAGIAAGTLLLLLIFRSDAAAAPRAKTRKCPDCAEIVQAEARKCRFCGKTFEAQTAVRLGPKRMTSLDRYSK